MDANCLAKACRRVAGLPGRGFQGSDPSKTHRKLLKPAFGISIIDDQVVSLDPDLGIQLKEISR